MRLAASITRLTRMGAEAGAMARPSTIMALFGGGGGGTNTAPPELSAGVSALAVPPAVRPRAHAAAMATTIRQPVSEGQQAFSFVRLRG